MSEVQETEPTVKPETVVEKEKFYEELNRSYSERKVKKPWDLKQYNQVLDTLKRGNEKSADGKKRTNSEYYYTGKYDIIEIDGSSKIILKQKSNHAITHVVPLEDYFEIIDEFHKSTGHGRRDKIMNALKKNNNIPRFAVETYLKLCSICAARKNSVNQQGLFHRMVASNDYTSRGQVDLMDFQSTPDGDYKWVLNYQDLSTKFLYLRPLHTKGASEIANELVKIFLTHGAPTILHSDNGKEFVATIVTEVMRLWPECKIVHGSHRHPESQESMDERSHQEVEEMLKSWMKENNTEKWSMGCYFVQWQKNVSFHRVICRSPYRALYNRDPKIGLQSTCLPQELLGKITTEDDLKRYLTLKSVTDDQNNAQCADDPIKMESTGSEFDGSVTDGEFENLVCCVCKQESSEAHSCDSCSKIVHETCGREIEEEVDGIENKLICNSCVDEIYPMLHQNGAKQDEGVCAKKIKMSSE